jgi:uncharacterized protein YqhQ
MYTGVLRKIPMVRGIIVLVETFSLGFSALTYSANVGAEAEEKEIGTLAMATTILISISFAIGLFFVLPVLASKALETPLDSNVLANLSEGVIRLVVFLGYIFLIGKMPSIRRVFMYHGAEHMTIHAYESDESLDIESVRKYPTAHPRCGTAFLLTVMVVSIAVFTFIGREPFWWLILSRIVLVPIIAAISYEVIRYSGLHMNNKFVRYCSAPSLALQALTTQVPDDDQIEIAIAAMEQVLVTDNSQ